MNVILTMEAVNTIAVTLRVLTAAHVTTDTYLTMIIKLATVSSNNFLL